MARRVDCAQPDGPEIDRYSPFLTSKWMLWRACVSTSSVTKTLLTFSSRSSGWPLSIFIYPFYVSGVLLVQLYSIVCVVSGHIGENYHIPDLQSILHLDGVHRGASQTHLHFVRVLSIQLQLEELDCGVLLPEYRALHIDHIVEALQLDGAIHAEVRAGAIRQ